MKIKITKGEATTFELVLMIILGLYYIQDVLLVDPVTWAQSGGYKRRLLVAHYNPTILRMIELSLGVLLLTAVAWNIYKRYKMKRH